MRCRASRSSGFRVALDDFGTGYASLTHLLSVPVDAIKIDRSFVSRLLPGDPSMVIVEGIIEIARKLGIRVVAEGIETIEQGGRAVPPGLRHRSGLPLLPRRRCEQAGRAARLHAEAAPRHAHAAVLAEHGDAAAPASAAPARQPGEQSPEVGRPCAASRRARLRPRWPPPPSVPSPPPTAELHQHEEQQRRQHHRARIDDVVGRHRPRRLGPC